MIVKYISSIRNSLLLLLVGIYLSSANSALQAQSHYQEVKILSEFGYSNEALYFPGSESGSPETAVVLVHQSSAHKESWTDFALALQNKGIPSLSIEDVGRRDVLDAIQYLKDKGHQKVMLVGASIGGGAVLQASSQANKKMDGVVTKVVLLSTSSASAIVTPGIDKLFIVAKSDMWGSDSHDIFEESTEPKKLYEFEGFAHGQDLLVGKDGKEITTLILNFLSVH
ncbi:alpha/beta hydrolase [Kiloniella sp.]|uniref:alpha/beta hydrolase n=1 Tax=Kiloniella sp. TaxID=1938587 RepID=UPI003B02021A